MGYGKGSRYDAKSMIQRRRTWSLCSVKDAAKSAKTSHGQGEMSANPVYDERLVDTQKESNGKMGKRHVTKRTC